jgi:spermidine/putrescine-binding protein
VAISRLRAAALLTAGALIVSACSGGAPSGDNDGSTLVVNGYGGEYQDIWMSTVGRPFEEETGIKVSYLPTGSADEDYVAIRAAMGDPGFDIAVMTAQEVIQGGKDGLLAKVTESDVPNLANVYPEISEAVGDAGVVHELQQVVLMYDTNKFPEPPTSWEVMWDPRYRDGTLVWQPSNILGVYQMLIAADLAGGNEHNVQPGWAKLGELAGDAHATPSSSSEAVPYMEQGALSAFPYFDGRAAIYSETTQYDYVVPKEGTYALLAALGIPSGAHNKEAAYKLMNYWLSDAVQARWAQAYHVGPSVEGVELPLEARTGHITEAEDLANVRIADAQTIIDNRSDYLKQWQQLFG